MQFLRESRGDGILCATPENKVDFALGLRSLSRHHKNQMQAKSQGVKLWLVSKESKQTQAAK